MNPLVIIPARGGSKRLPNKNILPLGGKPLILHTVDFARKHFLDDQICVSTDDDRILEIVQQSGLNVRFKRPNELATDISSTQDVLKHTSNIYEFEFGFQHDLIILLQPTTPFRLDSDLQNGLILMSNNPELDMVVSVTETKSNPYFVLFEDNEQGFLDKSKKGSFTRSQDSPKVWEFNGSMYFINKVSLFNKSINEFSKVKKLVMDELCSIDIDTKLDFDFANFLIENNRI